MNFFSFFFLFLTVLKGPWPVMLTGFLFFLIHCSSGILFYLSFGSSSALAAASLNSFFFLSSSLWLRDLVRETAKKCSLVPLGVFIFGFALFVVSEAILFSAIFWASFHFTSSPFFSFQEALFLPDPCELTYGNTLLLSNAAVSLGSGFSSLLGSPHIPFLLAWTFLSLQIKEFRNLGFYVSDSLYGSVFFFLSGLHFFHVLVGLVILGILSTFPSAFGRAIFHFLCTSQDLYFTVQVLYWHFVEVLWLFIIHRLRGFIFTSFVTFFIFTNSLLGINYFVVEATV